MGNKGCEALRRGLRRRPARRQRTFATVRKGQGADGLGVQIELGHLLVVLKGILVPGGGLESGPDSDMSCRRLGWKADGGGGASKAVARASEPRRRGPGEHQPTRGAGAGASELWRRRGAAYRWMVPLMRPAATTGACG